MIARLPPEARPIPTVVVDTEEQFDWSSDASSLGSAASA
jgi:hypothetical protein